MISRALALHITTPINGTIIESSSEVNRSFFLEKTTTVSFTLGANINSLQMLYEQGGSGRGLNVFIESGKIYASVWGRGWLSKELSTTVEAGKSYVASLAFNGTVAGDGSATLYLNGKEVAQTNGIGPLQSHSDPGMIGDIAGQSLVHGEVKTGTNYTYQGTIHEVSQYNGYLDATEVSEIQNQAMQAFVGVPDTKKKMILVISDGQSLSVGVSGKPVISVDVIHPETALMLDFANPIYGRDPGTAAPKIPILDPSDIVGFTGVRSYLYESHVPGMLNRLVENYERAGLESPTFLSIAAGSGGKSIEQLSFSIEKNTFSTIQEGLSATKEGEWFVQKSEVYQVTNGQAVIKPNFINTVFFYDNLVKQVARATELADAAGYEIDKNVIFTWRQGSANSGTSADIYRAELEKLLSNFTSDVEKILGHKVELDFFSQIRHEQSMGGQGTSNFIYGTQNSHVTEQIARYMGYMDELDGSPSGHQNAIGYNLTGQEMGDRIFETLNGAAEDDFLHIEHVFVDKNILTVDFSGLKGFLVEDVSVPHGANLGFHLYTENFKFSSPKMKVSVISAEITGKDQVTVTLDHALSPGEIFNLGIAAIQEKSTIFDRMGSSLRDSEVGTPDNYWGIPLIDDYQIKRFAYQQYIKIDAIGTLEDSFEMNGGRPVAGRISGTNNGDNLLGQVGSEKILGLSGDDIIFVSGGDDVIDGGEGKDTLDFSLMQNIYDVVLHEADDVSSVEILVTNLDGSQYRQLSYNIENFLFEDTFLYRDQIDDTFRWLAA